MLVSYTTWSGAPLIHVNLKTGAKAHEVYSRMGGVQWKVTGYEYDANPKDNPYCLVKTEKEAVRLLLSLFPRSVDHTERVLADIERWAKGWES